MNTKSKPHPEKSTTETEPVKETGNPLLVSCQLPNLIVVETDESHLRGRLIAYLNGKRVMETVVTQAGQEVYQLSEFLPEQEVYDLSIGFVQASS